MIHFPQNRLVFSFTNFSTYQLNFSISFASRIQFQFPSKIKIQLLTLEFLSRSTHESPLKFFLRRIYHKNLLVFHFMSKFTSNCQSLKFTNATWGFHTRPTRRQKFPNNIGWKVASDWRFRTWEREKYFPVALSSRSAMWLSFIKFSARVFLRVKDVRVEMCNNQFSSMRVVRRENVSYTSLSRLLTLKLRVNNFFTSICSSLKTSIVVRIIIT